MYWLFQSIWSIPAHSVTVKPQISVTPLVFGVFHPCSSIYCVHSVPAVSGLLLLPVCLLLCLRGCHEKNTHRLLVLWVKKVFVLRKKDSSQRNCKRQAHHGGLDLDPLSAHCGVWRFFLCFPSIAACLPTRYSQSRSGSHIHTHRIKRSVESSWF
mgnify:CR=1 FL=1